MSVVTPGRAFKIVPGNGYQTYPDKASNPASLTGAAWSLAGTWVEVVSSTAADVFLAGMSWGLSNSGTSAREWELDIGVGSAGSEVVIATISGTTAASEPQIEYMQWFQTVIPVDAGVRISMRVRLNTGSTGRFPQDTRVIYVAQSEVVPV